MQEEDPTAIDPDEEGRPPKPPISVPEIDDEVPGEEDVPEDEYLHPEVAADDDSIDDKEADEVT